MDPSPNLPNNTILFTQNTHQNQDTDTDVALSPRLQTQFRLHIQQLLALKIAEVSINEHAHIHPNQRSGRKQLEV